jgi:hypothetical protein
MKIQAFASKELPELQKKLFKRVHGIQNLVDSGSNIILYSIPYAWVKITGMEIINGENLDQVSVEILDSTTGTYSTIPNYKLNQFAYNINVSKDYYEHKSEYDADLYANMQIRITYNSLTAKTIGINFIMNEVI